MNYNKDFPVRKGTIECHSVSADYAIAFPSMIDPQYSYVVYKTVVFFMDRNRKDVSSGSIKICTDDYVYVMFWMEPVPDVLFDECWDILEAMARQVNARYSFFVVDSNDFTYEDQRLIGRGYEEFDGLDDDLLAERLGARIIHDKSFRKLVCADKSRP